MFAGLNSSVRLRRDWVHKFLIGVFFVAIAAALVQFNARLLSLKIEAASNYVSFLSNFNLTENFHVVYFLGLESIVAIVYGATALILARHRPMTGMTALASLALMFYGITIPPPMHTLVVNIPAALPTSVRLIRSIGLGLLIIFFYLFPNGKFSPGWLKWLAITIMLWLLIFPFYPPLNPYQWVEPFPLLSLAALFGTGVFAQLYQYFRVSNLEEKQQTKWVVFGIVVTVLGDLITHAPWAFSLTQKGPDWYLLMLHHPFFVVSQLFLPLSICFSILHYGLWEIDFVLNRTLVYGLLSAILVMILSILQKFLELFFQGITGDGGLLLAVGIASLATALLFQPIYTRIDHAVRHYLHNPSVDYIQDFIEFSPDVRNLIGFSGLTQEIVRRTVDLTQTEYGVVFIGKNSQDLSIASSYKIDAKMLQFCYLEEASLNQLQEFKVIDKSQNPTFPTLVPLYLPRKVNPELIGVLALGKRTSGRGYSSEEKSALKKLGQEAGFAIYVTQISS